MTFSSSLQLIIIVGKKQSGNPALGVAVCMGYTIQVDPYGSWARKKYGAPYGNTFLGISILANMAKCDVGTMYRTVFLNVPNNLILNETKIKNILNCGGQKKKLLDYEARGHPEQKFCIRVWTCTTTNLVRLSLCQRKTDSICSFHFFISIT